MSSPEKPVFVLKTVAGNLVAIFASQESADATRDRYNADPWIAPGEPDPDAPYYVQAWMLRP